MIGLARFFSLSVGLLELFCWLGFLFCFGSTQGRYLIDLVFMSVALMEVFVGLGFGSNRLMERFDRLGFVVSVGVMQVFDCLGFFVSIGSD